MKETFKAEFAKIKRPGADKLLAWLETTDFYTAPASTRYHLARPGGLVEHSLNVYNRLTELYIAENFEGMDESKLESLAIIGLLHDVCKADFYTMEFRNRKNDHGSWEQYPVYTVNDKLPYGHGEKSVYIISGFMRLTREEAMAIRWHMSAFETDSSTSSYTLSAAYKQYPLAVLTHVADLMATYIDEKETET